VWINFLSIYLHLEKKKLTVSKVKIFVLDFKIGKNLNYMISFLSHQKN